MDFVNRKFVREDQVKDVTVLADLPAEIDSKKKLCHKLDKKRLMTLTSYIEVTYY